MENIEEVFFDSANQVIDNLDKVENWLEDRKRIMDVQYDKYEADINNRKTRRAFKNLEIQNRVANEIELEAEKLNDNTRGYSEIERSRYRLNYLKSIQWVPDDYQYIDVDKSMLMLSKFYFSKSSSKDEVEDYFYTNNRIGQISSNVLLFIGPEGIGKTYLAEQIAKAMGRELHIISLAGVKSDSFLEGRPPQFADSKPGEIVDVLYRTGHRKLVILVDEIDKIGCSNGSGTCTSLLIEILGKNRCFVDRFLEIPVDVSDVVFIATATDKAAIPDSLLGRLNEIQLLPFTKAEKLKICKSFIIPSVKAEYGLYGTMLEIDDKVINQLVVEDSDSGCRSLNNKIRKICRTAAKHQATCGSNSFLYSEQVAIDSGLIKNSLQKKVTAMLPGKVITSLTDDTTNTGSWLEIDSLILKNEKKSTILGDCAKLYSDVVKQMEIYVDANEAKLEINNNYSFAIDMGEVGITSFDGNHKLPIFFSIYSAKRDVTLPYRLMIVGDVSLLGEVKSNSKTLSHIINAIDSGAEILILPRDIEKYLDRSTFDKNIEFFFIDNLRQTVRLMEKFEFYNDIQKEIAEDGIRLNNSELRMYEREILQIAVENKISKLAALQIYCSAGTEAEQAACEEVSNYVKEEPPIEELEKLIGLTSVKELMQEIVIWKEVAKKRKKRKIATKDVGLHMVFTGNPGTGKTTVAKLLGKMLYEKGLVRNNVFVEVTRDDLVGKYIGHTEEKISKVIKQSLGGVLYIDEAHSLFMDSDHDFGKIVISSLVKGIEENRDDLVLIMSGYEDEMTQMIESNCGLSDRINYKIHFDDYSASELTDIMMHLCSEEEYILEDSELEYFKEQICLELKKKNDHFSNGRFVRNIFEKAKVKQAMRISEMTNISDNDFHFLLEEDIANAFKQEVNSKLVEKQISIGF